MTNIGRKEVFKLEKTVIATFDNLRQPTGIAGETKPVRAICPVSALGNLEKIGVLAEKGAEDFKKMFG